MENEDNKSKYVSLAPKDEEKEDDISYYEE